MSELKKNGAEFLSILEGYHQLLKELHWSTNIKSEHLLTDDIDNSVLEYEDKISENLMGLGSFRYGLGDLKTLLPNSKNLADILKELEKDIVEFKDKFDDKKYSGIINILDDFLTDVNKWKYLETFK